MENNNNFGYKGVLDSEVHSEGRELVVVSNWKRLANYFVDIILIEIIFTVTVYFFATLNSSNADEAGYLMGNILGSIWSTLLIYVLMVIFYVFFEYNWQKTPGKFITKSIVVDYDGNKPDFKTILLRSVYRIVPFEAISFIGKKHKGWHDVWSKTLVVEDK